MGRKTRSMGLASRHGLLLLFAMGGLAPASLYGRGLPYPDISCITRTLPPGVVGADYRSRVVMVNATAPLSMTMTGLPPGLGFDAHTGYIFGRPTEPGEFAVEATGTDGDSTAVSSGLVVAVSVPTGPLPAALAVDALPDGRVGVPYAVDLAADGGVGPMVFGADELPPGLSLLGRTGEVRGTPTAAGTWFVAVTVLDVGANTLTGKEVALVVDPPGSSFRFVTRGLNAEGFYFFDRLFTSGATGPVTFEGDGSIFFNLDPVTGAIGGPIDFVMSGSGGARVTASDGTDTIETALPQLILPPGGMYFDFDSLPAAFAGVDYGREPPVRVAASNAPEGTVYYAEGLPAGMDCNPTTGALAGRPLQAGSYYMVLSARGGQGDEGVIRFALPFLVLPPGGGDASTPVSNYWSFAQELHPSLNLDGSWSGSALWNADRREGVRFDPTSDSIYLNTAFADIDVPQDSLRRGAGTWTYRAPLVEVRLSAARERMSWRTAGERFSESFPASLYHRLFLGGRFYFQAQLDFDERGLHRPGPAGRSPSFVVARGHLARRGPAAGTLHVEGFLADSSMAYEPGTTPLRFRLLDGAREILSRDLTDRGFARSAATGRWRLDLRGADLSTVPRGVAHLGIELTVGAHAYYTAVTFFGNGEGRYSTAMPSGLVPAAK